MCCCQKSTRCNTELHLGIAWLRKNLEIHNIFQYFENFKSAAGSLYRVCPPQGPFLLFQISL